MVDMETAEELQEKINELTKRLHQITDRDAVRGEASKIAAYNHKWARLRATINGIDAYLREHLPAGVTAEFNMVYPDAPSWWVKIAPDSKLQLILQDKSYCDIHGTIKTLVMVEDAAPLFILFVSVLLAKESAYIKFNNHFEDITRPLKSPGV